MEKSAYGRYEERVVKEAKLKSFLWGLTIGCLVLFLTTFFSWMFAFKEGLWLGLGLFVVFTLIATFALYFLKFRPSAKAVAKRIDELGLEERVLTMNELKDDDSYIAQLQRQDTERVLKNTDHRLVKIVIATSLIVVLSLGGVFALSFTTTNALYYAGVIPSGLKVIENMKTPNYYTLSYTVGEGEGSILYADIVDEDVDAEVQTVREGESGRAVWAEGKPNWFFIQWSDGSTDPYRCDVDVKSNIEVTAVFAQMVTPVIDEQDKMEQQQSSQSQDGDSDESDGKPSDDEEQSSGNSQSSSQDEQQEQQPEPSPGSSDGSGAGGGRNQDSNQVVDGQTYYGDRWSDSHREELDRVGSNEGFTDEEKDLVSDYFGSIEKDGNADGGDSGSGGSGGSGSDTGGENGGN